MARALRHPNRFLPVRLTAAALVIAVSGATALAVTAPAGAATEITPTSASWCTVHGSSVGVWVTTTPRLPICGPGPAYGGTWAYVTIPGPFGSLNGYFNATPGFQCVELAERYLSVVDGLTPVKANGAQVAENYHAANADTALVVNGSPGAVGHAPAAGDVISVSSTPGFSDDGHVAVVVGSDVDGAGNGKVTIAQQNVSSADYIYTLGLSDWHLFDPAEPQNALFQFHYAEWLSPLSVRSASGGPAHISLGQAATTAVPSGLLPLSARKPHVHKPRVHRPRVQKSRIRVHVHKAGPKPRHPKSTR